MSLTHTVDVIIIDLRGKVDILNVIPRIQTLNKGVGALVYTLFSTK